eukprot:5763287-Pyramimonas_sp.AAC.1
MLGPIRRLRMWQQFRGSQLPRGGEVIAAINLSPRGTSLCGGPQQPSNVATVSRAASPRGWWAIT